MARLVAHKFRRRAHRRGDPGDARRGAQAVPAVRGAFEQEPGSVLACPQDKAPLRTEVTVIGGVSRIRRVSKAGIVYPVNDLYTDLVPSSRGSKAIGLEELGEELLEAFETRAQTLLFRSPLTSFLYERGWREGFKNAGFPGIEAEFAEVSEFFAPARGGIVVDMSCGSGLMTRRLVKSGAYARVFALDYSESMLRETARRAREEGLLGGAGQAEATRLELCR